MEEVKIGLSKKETISILKKHGVDLLCKNILNQPDEEFKVKDITSRLWELYITNHNDSNKAFLARAEIHSKDNDAMPVFTPKGSKYTYNRSQH